MAFLDDNWLDDTHSPSAKQIVEAFKSYLKSAHGMGDPGIASVASKMRHGSIGQCCISDYLNDPNPDPKAKALSLGYYFRKALGSAGYNWSPQSMDNMAWGGARAVYVNKKNWPMFSPEEIKMPFFAEVLGAVAAEGAGTVAAVVVTVVTENKAAGEVAGAGVKAQVACLGNAIRTRLSERFIGGIVLLDPDKWPTRKSQRDAQDQALANDIQTLLLTSEAAKVNAETQLLMAKNQNSKVKQVILTETAQAQQTNLATKLATQSKLTTTAAADAASLKKKEAIKTIAIAGGGVALAAIVLVIVLR